MLWCVWETYRRGPGLDLFLWTVDERIISAIVSPFAYGPLVVVVIVAGRVVNFLPNTDPETKHNAAVMDPPRAGGVCRWKLRNFSLIATHGRVPNLLFAVQGTCNSDYAEVSCNAVNFLLKPDQHRHGTTEATERPLKSHVKLLGGGGKSLQISWENVELSILCASLELSGFIAGPRHCWAIVPSLGRP